MCCWIISFYYDFCCFRYVSHCMSSLTVYKLMFCTFILAVLLQSNVFFLLVVSLPRPWRQWQSLTYFVATSFTFWDHVTSSVTWPLDSAYVVSYWWFVVTMRLTCTVTEIEGLKVVFAHVKGHKFTVHAPCHVQNDHIFGIPDFWPKTLVYKILTYKRPISK